MFCKKSKTIIENSGNRFVGIRVCYIFAQEPYLHFKNPSLTDISLQECTISTFQQFGLCAVSPSRYPFMERDSLFKRKLTCTIQVDHCTGPGSISCGQTGPERKKGARTYEPFCMADPGWEPEAKTEGTKVCQERAARLEHSLEGCQRRLGTHSRTTIRLRSHISVLVCISYL